MENQESQSKEVTCDLSDIIVYCFTLFIGFAMSISASIYGYRGCAIYGVFLIVVGALTILYSTKDKLFRAIKPKESQV